MTPEEIAAARQGCARVRVSRPTHHVHCANSIATLLDRLEEAIGLLRNAEAALETARDEREGYRQGLLAAHVRIDQLGKDES